MTRSIFFMPENSESPKLNVKDSGEGIAAKSENNGFIEDRRREELEAYQLIHADLLSQAEQQIQALQLTVNTTDQINDRQDLFFDSRIFKDEDELKGSEDDLDWSNELSKLSLEEKAYFSKKIIEKENVYTKLSSLDKKYSFPLLLDLAVKLYGGTKLSTGEYKLSYDLVREIEDNSWWPLLEKQLKESYPQVLEQWAKNKSSALDIALVQSLGHQGTTGYLLDILDDNGGAERYGQKKLRKQLKQANKDIRIKKRRTKLIKNGKKRYEVYQEVNQKLDSKDPNWQKILDAYNLLDQQQLVIPKSLLNLRQRLLEVVKGQDAHADNKKRLRTVNLLRLIGMLAPLVSDQYAAIPENDEKDWSAFDRLFSSKVGHQILTLVEKATFHTLSVVPDDFWGKVGDNDAIFNLLDNHSFSDLKAVIDQLDQDVKSGNNDITVENITGVYPDDRIDSLVELYSKENENYEGLTDIFQNAIDHYQEMCLKNGESAQTVYWQKHPDYTILSPQNVVNSYNDSDEQISASTNIQAILAGSDYWFSDWEDVFSMYNAINPEDAFTNEEELKAYFADYFGFVLEQYDETKQASRMEDVLSVALYKNNGDMSRALWDVSIFYKMLTRNNLDTGEPSLENSSGALTIKYLEDQFSYGYTAADVAEILPESQYWSTNNDLGDNELAKYKDFDPSSINGIPYHITNCVALLEDFPATVVVGGVLMDFMKTSGGYDEHGSYKLETQLRYLVDNILPAQQFLEGLPDNPEKITDADDISVIPLEPYDKRLYGDNSSLAWQNLFNGNNLLLPDGRTIKLTGSPATPLLTISSQEHNDLFLKTQDVNIADIDVDGLINSGRLLSGDGNEEPFQKLDADTIVRILEQHEEAADLNVMYIDSDQVSAVLETLQKQHPDDWILYTLSVPQLADGLEGSSFIDLIDKVEDQEALNDYFQKICTHYAEGWNKVWTASEISTAMHEKLFYDGIIRIMDSCPEFIEALYGDASFSEYIKTEASLFNVNDYRDYTYYKSFLLNNIIIDYEGNLDKLWSEEEIMSVILSGDHSTIAGYVLDAVEGRENFNNLLKQAPIELLIASFDDARYDNTDLADYFSTHMLNAESNFSQEEAEHLLSVLKTELPENWMYFVVNCPKAFSEYYKDMNFTDFVNQTGIDQKDFINYFLNRQYGVWEENWSAGEIFDSLRQQFPFSWGDAVAEHADVFAETINTQGITIEEVAINSEDSDHLFPHILSHYDDCWSKRYSLDSLISLMDFYDPENKIINILLYSDLFIPYFEDYSFNEFIQKLGNSEEVAVEILRNYNHDWGRLWSEEEIREAIKSSYPELYNECLEEGYFSQVETSNKDLN